MQKIRVLLVDDHSILREGIKALLENQRGIEVVAEAENGREAVLKAAQIQPDVVILDISMPLMDGLEATRQMKRESPEVKILVLTMYDDEEYFFQLLRAGASGYVTKKAVGTELASAIEAVYRGESYFCPSMSKYLLSDYLRLDRATEHIEQVELTSREREIVKLIAEGYTNQQIADSLHRSVKTIESHRSNILRKLDIHDTIELVKYAVRKKLIEI
ncbi:response regulator [Candidatus Poribacteria bacterium]